MRNYWFVILLFIIGVLTFSSCKKKIKGCTDPNATNYDPQANVDDGSCQYQSSQATGNPGTPFKMNWVQKYGVLAAMKSDLYYYSNGSFMLTSSTENAIAYFTSDWGNTLDNVGQVICEGDTLQFVTPHNYYVPSFILFVTPPIDWQVTGNINWPQITHSYNKQFPTLSVSNVPPTVSKSQGVSVNINSISNADSILFMLVDTLGNYAFKFYPVSANIVSFSPSDLANLSPTNSANLHVVAWNWDSIAIGGTKYYFINEKVKGYAVNITP